MLASIHENQVHQLKPAPEPQISWGKVVKNAAVTGCKTGCKLLTNCTFVFIAYTIFFVSIALIVYVTLPIRKQPDTGFPTEDHSVPSGPKLSVTAPTQDHSYHRETHPEPLEDRSNPSSSESQQLDSEHSHDRETAQPHSYRLFGISKEEVVELTRKYKKLTETEGLELPQLKYQHALCIDDLLQSFHDGQSDTANTATWNVFLSLHRQVKDAIQSNAHLLNSSDDDFRRMNDDSRQADADSDSTPKRYACPV